LTTLDRIGEVVAQRIVDYREQNGPFATIEDLKKVKGIGEKVFEANKDRITVSAPAGNK
jgi:competence protein ComEA